jgi:hypothetical protein
VSRRTLLAGAAVAVVALVAGFVLFRTTRDDDPFASYCDEVVAQRDKLGAALAAGAETGLIRALPSFQALERKSPDDIRPDWRLVVARISDLEDALAAAGVDAASYDRERPPAGLSQAKKDAIDAAAARLGSQETNTALRRVDQQARDVCKTPLSL